MTADPDVLVIGGGPAGLMAAEMALTQGCRVILAEAKPSVGRKFLMAGKSGLNLTRVEPMDQFLRCYGSAASWLTPALSQFGPPEVIAWTEALGQQTFIGSTGRVFPKTMKASPLLRAWLARLAERGLDLRTRWRWVGFDDTRPCFQTPEGPVCLKPSACILALGGASWRRLGSDGAWQPILEGMGIRSAPFQPSNVGITVNWSQPMAKAIGQPLKAVMFRSGDMTSRGEAMITALGLEGGGLYALGPALRCLQPLQIDLFPDLPTERLAARIGAQNRRESISNRFRKLGLEGGRLALALELARPLDASAEDAAQALKALHIPYSGTRPIDEAISTAGGILHEMLTEDLMIRAIPGLFMAGEMLDWDAPTGGYLLTACLATGRLAGLSAARWSIDHARKEKAAR